MDEHMLRRTFAVAAPRDPRADTPFGAVLVGPDGRVLLEQGYLANAHDADGRRAGIALAGRAQQAYDAEFLLDCTLYASADPCVTCAGAAYGAGIGRVVFGMPTGSWPRGVSPS